MERETELEMVQRHVREGEEHVRWQAELLAKLEERGAPTAAAITLLEQFKVLQHKHKAHLTRLEAGKTATVSTVEHACVSPENQNTDYRMKRS